MLKLFDIIYHYIKKKGVTQVIFKELYENSGLVSDVCFADNPFAEGGATFLIL